MTILRANDLQLYGVSRKFATTGITGASGTYIEATAGLADRTNITVYNAGSGDLYIGASGTAEANLFPVPTGQSISIDVTAKDYDNAGTAKVFLFGPVIYTVNARVLELA